MSDTSDVWHADHGTRATADTSYTAIAPLMLWRREADLQVNAGCADDPQRGLLIYIQHQMVPALASQQAVRPLLSCAAPISDHKPPPLTWLRQGHSRNIVDASNHATVAISTTGAVNATTFVR